MTEEVAEYLYDIVDDIEQLVSEQGELPTVETVYRSIDCSNYEYDLVRKQFLENESVDDSYIEISQGKETRTEISDEAKEDAIISEVEESDSYEVALNIINNEIKARRSSISGDTDPIQYPPDYLLWQFVLEVLNRVLDTEGDSLDEVEKSTLISTLTREIESPNLKYNSTIWLYGIGTEAEKSNIGDRMTIEQPSAKDFSMNYNLDDGFRMNVKFTPQRPPTLKITHSARGQNINDVHRENYVILVLLRLYAVTSSDIVGHKIRPESPFRSSLHNWTDVDVESGIAHGSLEEGDSEHLESCIDSIEEPLRNRILDASEQNYLSIAFNRYENSLIKEDSGESAIASSIMALEALYLRENEEGELSHRLAQRSSVLLSCLDYEPLEVYHRIVNGYGVRSSYVHGTKTSDDFSPDLSLRTMEFARKSLVLILQLDDSYSKEELISKLDNAVLDETARDKLKEEIEDLCGYTPLKSH